MEYSNQLRQGILNGRDQICIGLYRSRLFKQWDQLLSATAELEWVRLPKLSAPQDHPQANIIAFEDALDIQTFSRWLKKRPGTAYLTSLSISHPERAAFRRFLALRYPHGGCDIWWFHDAKQQPRRLDVQVLREGDRASARQMMAESRSRSTGPDISPSFGLESRRDAHPNVGFPSTMGTVGIGSGLARPDLEQLPPLPDFPDAMPWQDIDDHDGDLFGWEIEHDK